MNTALDDAELLQEQQAPPVDGVPPVAAVAPGAPAPAAVVPQGPGAAPPEAEALAPPQFDAMPPPPPPPALTGNPQQDVQNNILHQRALEQYHGDLMQRQGDLNQYTAKVHSGQASKEVIAEREAGKVRQRENEEFGQQRAQRQAAIDRSMAEREAAAKDLESADWGKHKKTGGEIVAIIAGALGAAFQNVAAAQTGHVGTAQNEALGLINKKMQMEYQHKRDRLANASDSLMQARYGFKDAQDNHRAALNDLDADTAAKYRLIAKEAEAQLRTAGVPATEIEQNALVLDARQKAAVAEGQIHAREEQHADARKHYAAEEALANANLGIARGNLSLHRLAETDAHQDRLAAIEARKANAANAADSKQTATLDRELKSFDNRNNIPKAIAARDKILGVKSELDDPNASPSTIASAIMEFDTAKRQGTATAQSYNALATHLAPGFLNKVQAIVAHGSGKFTPEELKQLRAGVDAAIKTSDEEGNRLHDAFKSTFYGNPKLAGEKDKLGAESEGRFARWGFQADATRAREAAEKAEANRPAPPTARDRFGAARAGGPAPADAPSGGPPPSDAINQAWQALDDKGAAPAVKKRAVKVLSEAGLI